MELVIIGSASVALFILIIVFSIVNHKRGDRDQYYQKPTSFTPLSERRGIEGERMVNHALRQIIHPDEYLLTNILLPCRNGEEMEIDSLLITRKGIFCIEIKNWIGHIYGDEQSEEWLQQYDDPYMSDKRHQNPFKQNEAHCSLLRQTLQYQFEIINIVLFPRIEDRSHLNAPSTFAIDDFKRYYAGLPEDKLFYSDIKEVGEKLKDYQATPERLKMHRENVKRKHPNQ